MLNSGVFNAGQEVGKERKSGSRQHRLRGRESQRAQTSAFSAYKHHSIGGVDNVLSEAGRCGPGNLSSSLKFAKMYRQN